MKTFRVVSLSVLASALTLAFLASDPVGARPPGGLAERVAALETDNAALRAEVDDLSSRLVAIEDLLVHVSRSGNDVFIDGANLHVRNGLGQTGTVNGVGNVIVGYNEERLPLPDNDRSGSHMLVVGEMNNYSSFGGIVGGTGSTTSGDYASVLGGFGNVASFFGAVVSGGASNVASGQNASVSGGDGNVASGNAAAISGGRFGEAVAESASVAGGFRNRAAGTLALAAGGQDNRATAGATAILGGVGNEATGYGATVAGGGANLASGPQSAVSGGSDNEARGDLSVVSGGQLGIAPFLGSHPDTHRP